jgi:hypothetical protein
VALPPPWPPRDPGARRAGEARARDARRCGEEETLAQAAGQIPLVRSLSSLLCIKRALGWIWARRVERVSGARFACVRPD